MDKLVTRVGVLFVVALLAFVAMVLGVDQAFSVHMGIACVAALIAMAVSMNKFDFLTQRFPVLSGPTVASRYDDDPIRWGVIATMFWGIAGFLVGLIIALQLAFPLLNLNLEYTTFGRLRPLTQGAS